MRTKPIGIFLIFLLLFRFNLPVIACCEDDPPGECYVCEDGVWVEYGDCWGGCPTCEYCIDCWCECTSECGCGGLTCPSCQSCTDCDCKGICWTKTTIAASIQQVCADCKNLAFDHCPGQYKEQIEHQRCSPASAGQSGYCECHESQGIIGYEYECVAYANLNWCICPLLYKMCKIVCAVCVVEPTPAGETACGACILEYFHECITPCSYVHKCDKDEKNPVPKYGPVFHHFAGDSCVG